MELESDNDANQSLSFWSNLEKNPQKGLRKQGVRGNIETVQTRSLLRSARIL